MAIQIAGQDGATIADVDTGHAAQRVSLRPIKVTAWTSIAAPTGLVTTLAAGASVFSLRYTGNAVCLVRRIQIQWITTTTFTAAQRLEFGLYVARGFSTADAGGLPLNVTSGKHRTSFAAPTLEARIAMTTALTAGTRTLDPHPIGIAALFSNAVGVTLAQTALLSQDSGDHPVALQNNEGLSLNNMLLMGAGGVGVVYVNCELAETASFG